MVIDKIEILNFKNIASAQLEFSPQINVLVGMNGSGKTNLLDAIYYLSITKSSLGLTDLQCVHRGEEFFMLQSSYVGAQSRESVVCSFKKKGSKVVRRNGKEYGRLSEHIGLIPVIFSSPSDTSLINEASDERRRFLNSSLSQIRGGYLELLIRYNHLLAERNRSLKVGGAFSEVIEVIDMQLVEVGSQIFDIREHFVSQLAPRTQALYEAISGGSESVTVAYKSALREADYATLLRESFSRDLVLGHTTVGVHRDDLRLEIDGVPIRKFGSQGQQKSMLLALKLALSEIITQSKGIRPLLLLDDVFDKLDMSRVENLLRVVSSSEFGQIFITDSNKVRLDRILERLDSGWRLLSVDGGEFEVLESTVI